MGDKTWHPDKVDGTVAKDLVGNVYLTNLDVLCFRQISHAALLLAAYSSPNERMPTFYAISAEDCRAAKTKEVRQITNSRRLISISPAKGRNIVPALAVTLKGGRERSMESC
jgi:hypothetical protein